MASARLLGPSDIDRHTGLNPSEHRGSCLSSGGKAVMHHSGARLRGLLAHLRHVLQSVECSELEGTAAQQAKEEEQRVRCVSSRMRHGRSGTTEQRSSSRLLSRAG